MNNSTHEVKKVCTNSFPPILKKNLLTALKFNRIVLMLVMFVISLGYGKLNAQTQSTMSVRGTINSFGNNAMTYRNSLAQTWIATVQANATNATAGFLFANNNSFSPKWARGAAVNFNSQTTWFANGSDGTYNQTSGNFYTFICQDQSGGTNSKGYLFETSATPVSVSTVAQSALATSVTVGQSVTVTATTSATLPTGQGVFLRYSTDNFSSSTIVSMTGSSVTYTATIPIATNTAGANVVYYVFTSGGTTAPAAADADLATINLNNNGGSNYTYTVKAWTTAANGNWSNAATWISNTVPPTGTNLGAVTIAHNVTQDQAAIVGALLVNDARTFTINTGNILQVGGAITRGGANTGAIAVNGTLQLNAGYTIAFSPTYGSSSKLIYNSGGTPAIGNEWTGSGTTAGSGIPQDVDIQNGTTLTLDAISSSKGIAGNLSLGTGSTTGNLTLGTNNTTNRFAVNGNLIIGGNTSGGTSTLTLSSGGTSPGIDVGGNWTRTAQGSFSNPGRGIFFIGSVNSIITTNTSEDFTFLIINKAASTNTVTLSNGITVSNTLTLTSGKIILGANNLTITSGNTITGPPSSSNYIVTDGAGSLILNGITSARTFPVGRSITSFSPISVTTGTSSNFTVRVSGTLPSTPMIPAQAVNLSWFVTSSNTAPSNLIFNWNQTTDGGASVSYGATQFDVGRSTGGAYTVLSNIGTASGSNPYALSVTSGSFGTGTSTYQYVVANNSALTIAENVADFRTNAVSLAFNAAVGWQYNDGSTWQTASGAPGANNNVSVLTGHNASLGANFSTTKTITINGGTLTAGTSVISGVGGVTLTSGTLTTAHSSGLSGTINTSGINTFTAGTITFNAGGSQSFGPGSFILSGIDVSTATSSTNVTLDGNVTIKSLTIASGTTFNNGTAQTLSMASAGTLTNSGTFTSGTGTVAFAGTGTITGTIGFNNVTLAGGVTFSSASTINGTLTLNTGGFVNTTAPSYANGSTLQYNTTGTYGRGIEWSTTTGAGYPFHVQISNSTTVNMGANSGASVNRQCAGNLTIDALSVFSMNTTAMTAAVTVMGNVLNSGTITLSGQIGGDLVVQGNVTDNGTFNANNRAVFFSGTNVQDLQGSGVFDIAYVRINKSGGRVRMLSNLTCQGPNGGNAMELNSGTSILDLNGFTLNLGQVGVSSTYNNLVGTPGFIRGSSTSTLNILGVGALGTISFETGNQTLGTLSVDRTSSGSATLGSPLIVATGLTVTSGTTLNNGGNNLTVSSAGSTNAAGIIVGSGALIKTGAGTLTLSAASGNNTINSYSGGTTINTGGSGTISVTGLSGISSAAITSSTQSVTFSSTTPNNATYQLLPGAITVGTQSFSSNAATSKAAALNYTNSTVTVQTAALNAVTLTNALSNTYGTASTPGVAFTASGTLSPSVTITATPNTGYQVSADNVTFQNTAISGISSGTTVYVRNAATRNAGNYNNTVAVVLTSIGVPDANVTTSASGNAVATAALTIIGLTGDNKAYNGTTAATASGTAVYSGLQNGESFIVSGTPIFTFASASAANGISISTTGYTAPNSNYSLTQPALSANITARGLTITGLTGDNKAYNGTTAATASGTAVYSGLQNGESFIVSGTPTFTFASASVANGISIGTTGYTAPNSNYLLTQPALSANITARGLTITGLTGVNKVYDGTTAATASGTAVYSGLQNGESFSVSGTPIFTFASANVANGISIGTTGYIAPNSNYSLTQPALSANITARGLTITGLTGDNKAYNGTTAATASGTAVYSGLQNGESFNVSGTPTFTFASANVANGISISTTGYTAPNSNYSLTQPALSANITARGLTITGLTGVNKAYDGTTAATASGTAVYSGLQNGESFIVSGTPIFTFASANVANGISIGTTGYTAPNSNYSLTQPALSANITARGLTITGLTGVNKAYNGTTAATASGTAVYSGLQNGESFSVSGTPIFTFASANVANGISISTTGYIAPNSNYSLTQPALSANITAASVTITPDAGQSKVFGAANPIYTFSTSPSVSTTGALSRVAGESVGSYAYTLGTLNAGSNYSLLLGGSNTFAITGNPPTNANFRSNGPVNFTANTNWYFDQGGNSWVPSAVAPTTNNNISILSGHTATLNSVFTVGVNKSLVLESGSNLEIGAIGRLEMNNTSIINFGDQSVTLKSNGSGTGSIGTILGTLSGATNVTVERYIPAIPGTDKRAWRLLSVPTKGAQTIRQAWQELGDGDAGNTILNSGFGTLITTPYANPTGNGFDKASVANSLLEYDGTAWQGALSTKTSIETVGGYFLYVRGDRTQGTNGLLTDVNPTTLRTKGELYQGAITSPSIPKSSYAVIGNIYPSRIDFTKLTRGAGIDNAFYIWDAKKVDLVANSLGLYQTFSATNNFKCIVNGGSFVFNSTGNNYIESGQAFFVRNNNTLNSTTVSIDEDAKVAGSSNSGFRPATPVNSLVSFTSSLYSVGGNIISMADANEVVFDNQYLNAVDGNDALKISNPGANFAIQQQSKALAIEGRQPIIDKDTIFYNMWNLQKRTYQLEFKTANLDNAGLTAILQDAHTGNNTILNLAIANTINFTVDATPASFAANRFRVVFAQTSIAPLPVSFISVSASRSAAGNIINWKVAAESNLDKYEVERSSDGRSFAKTGTVAASIQSTYSFTDAQAFSGTAFYRIKGIGLAGEVKYSAIVKLTAGNIKPGFSVSPNPAEGNMVNLQFKNQAAGNYHISISTIIGQRLFTNVVTHPGGSSTQVLNFTERLAAGTYQLEIIAPDKSRQTQSLVVKSND